MWLGGGRREWICQCQELAPAWDPIIPIPPPPFLPHFPPPLLSPLVFLFPSQLSSNFSFLTPPLIPFCFLYLRHQRPGRSFQEYAHFFGRVGWIDGMGWGLGVRGLESEGNKGRGRGGGRGRRGRGREMGDGRWEMMVENTSSFPLPPRQILTPPNPAQPSVLSST